MMLQKTVKVFDDLSDRGSSFHSLGPAAEKALSPYVLRDVCLFERLFKVKKNSVFLFGISFFVLEIFTFCIMQMREVMTSQIVH